jgi:hypothetical protein
LPFLALNAVHLARWRGNCRVAFGDPETADELARALDAMDSSFARAPVPALHGLVSQPEPRAGG